MQKIPTIFLRDASVRGHPVRDEWMPECLWVREGEGMATVKLDGQNVLIQGGQLLKRQKPVSGDYDVASYERCNRANPSDRYLWAAFDTRTEWDDGVYEAIGPKIQGNKYLLASHTFTRVSPVDPALVIHEELVRTFIGLRAYLVDHEIEGIVFHHPDGRLGKIKRRDYGLRW